jgi:hypothetical protein
MKWKSKKRPPNKTQRVLISDGDNVAECIYYKENKTNKWLSVDLNENYDKSITHWMPLPKSPNELAADKLKLN